MVEAELKRDIFAAKITDVVTTSDCTALLAPRLSPLSTPPHAQGGLVPLLCTIVPVASRSA
jgi:hypothetical protein